MEERVCEYILEKREEDKIKNKLQKYNYPQKTHITVYKHDNCFRVRIYKYHWYAMMYYEKDKVIDMDTPGDITIYYKDWYEVGKQIGKDFKLYNLYKCWEGAE